MGFIDHDTFCDWSYSTLLKFRDGHVHQHPGGWRSPKKSWKAYLDRENAAPNPRFVSFINSLRALGESSNTPQHFLFAEMIKLITTSLEIGGDDRGFAPEWRENFFKGMQWEYYVGTLASEERFAFDQPARQILLTGLSKSESNDIGNSSAHNPSLKKDVEPISVA
jgi:hypothetical protein